jgi:hypothetical protein
MMCKFRDLSIKSDSDRIDMPIPPNELRDKLKKAVASFWDTRLKQARRQGKKGNRDYGARAAVTGGAQMDSFISLLEDIVGSLGIEDTTICRKRRLIDLPGFFRPTKEWDLIVFCNGKLLAAVEVKSQVGPSFGNNFNNRTEEAMGSAMDLWTAYREGAFASSPQPWLGYLFLLEECPKSLQPVAVREPHFKVFPEFRGASYAKRYELFCLKLVRERHYSSTCFLMSNKSEGLNGAFSEPSPELTFETFARGLQAHLQAYTK